MIKVNILHCLGRPGSIISGQLCRSLVEGLGKHVNHSIIGGAGQSAGWLARAAKAANVEIPANFPDFNGLPRPGKLANLAQAISPYDLVLTYDYAALNIAMAHTAFQQLFGLPPVIHHEYGYGGDRQVETAFRRNWYRRIALGRTARLIVPSEAIEHIALSSWQQPISRVSRISPGIGATTGRKKVRRDALRGLIKHDGEFWIGSHGLGRKAENWLAVLGALAKLPEKWQFVIAGGEGEDEDIRQVADRMELSHRVHILQDFGYQTTFLALLDLYVEFENGDAFPFHALQAAGSGLPIAGIRGDAIKSVTGAANAEIICQPDGPDALTQRIMDMAQDESRLRQIGKENQKRVEGELGQKAMIDRLKRLYSAVIGREL